MRKGVLISFILVLSYLVWAQLPTVPNSDFPTFRTNLNTSLQKGVNKDSTYSNPSWLLSLAWSKITGAPSTLGPTGPTGPTGPSGPLSAGSVLTTRTANHTQNIDYCANTQPFNGSNLTVLLANPIVAGSCNFAIINLNTSTTLTIAPNGLTINGTASTLTLDARTGTTASGVACWSDSSNGGYKCWKGLQGIAGPTGPTGPSGGPTGPTGPAGPTGAGGGVGNCVQATNTATTVTTSQTAIAFTTNESTLCNDATMHSTSSNTTRFIAPSDGLYHADCEMNSATNPAAGFFSLAIYQNSTGTYYGQMAFTISGTATTALHTSADIVMTTSDYVECRAVGPTSLTLINGTTSPTMMTWIKLK